MKFLPQEHSDIVDLLTSMGVIKANYSFKKKHGLVHIELVGRPESFCFFRKTESILTNNLQFEDKVTYYYGSTKKQEVANWKELLQILELWLKSD